MGTPIPRKQKAKPKPNTKADWTNFLLHSKWIRAASGASQLGFEASYWYEGCHLTNVTVPAFSAVLCSSVNVKMPSTCGKTADKTVGEAYECTSRKYAELAADAAQLGWKT